MILRPYQLDAVNTLWQSLATDSHVLCVLPTGSGKTVIFTELIRRANVKTVVLLNREKLTRQTVDRLKGRDVGVFSASLGQKTVEHQITIATIQSISNIEVPDLRFIVVDEAHNLSESYYLFLDAHPAAKVLGFTATPFKDTGFIYGKDEFFPRIHFKRSVKQMIDEGHIVAPTAKAPKQEFNTAGLRTRAGEFRAEDVENLVDDDEKVKSQIADAMPRLVGRKKIVWVCSSIKHAENVKRLIPEDASIIHSKLEDTSWPLEVFERGPIRHMVAVMMLTEGYDFPAIDAVVLMRPTKSPKLYVQVVGRGLRPWPGKTDCLVLDYGQVIKHCGPIDDPNIGAKRPPGKNAAMDYLVRVCKACFSVCKKDATECPDCNTPLVEPRTDTTVREHQDRDILAKLISTEPVFSVTMSRYKSKKGNICLRIDYQTNNKWPRSEFFTNHPFSFSKCRRRLNELIESDTSLLSFDELVETIETYDNLIIPTALTINTAGVHATIEGLTFGDRDRESNLDLFELT